MYGFYGIVNRKLNEKLEREVEEYFETKYVFLVSSGKAALFLILSGLKKLNSKKKVIIPAYTCFSVPSAIRMAGLDIVLCDVRSETLDYDFSELSKLVDDDTLCIISTHMFGIPSDISRIRNIVAKRGIFIVEDAAQAMGCFGDDKKLGTLGDVAFYSLGRGKNITCGEGGIIITSVEEIGLSIKKEHSYLEKHSMIEYIKHIVKVIFLCIFVHPFLYWFPKLFPFLKIGETKYYLTFPVHRMTSFQAGLLHNWRTKLEKMNQKRAYNADYYKNNIAFSYEMPIYADRFQYLRFPIYLNGREVKDQLCEFGDSLGISPMYPSSINKIKELAEYFSNKKYACAEMIADMLVTLPTHILLDEKDKVEICEAVGNFMKPGSTNQRSLTQKV